MPVADVLQTAVLSLGLTDVAPFEIGKKVIGMPKTYPGGLADHAIGLGLEGFVREGHESAVTGGNVLEVVDRKTPRRRKGANPLTVQARAPGLSAILDDGDSARATQFQNLIHRRGMPRQMYHHHRAGAVGDFLGHRPRAGLDGPFAISEDRNGAFLNNAQGRTGIGVGRQDHLVARGDSRGDHTQMHRRRTAGTGYHVGNTQVLLHHFAGTLHPLAAAIEQGVLLQGIG